jgi:prepilin-type processing-associated H-X9-DG protein
MREGEAAPRHDPAFRSNFFVTDPLGKDFSYSFADPYPASTEAGPLASTYQYRPTDPPDVALAADRNDGDRWRTTSPDDGQAQIRPMNSSNHRRKGQNVLFNDGHVSWHDTPFCAHARDNIYTRSSPPGNSLAFPIDKYDSVLSPMFPLKNTMGM